MEASFKRIALLHSHSQLPVIDSRAMGALVNSKQVLEEPQKARLAAGRRASLHRAANGFGPHFAASNCGLRTVAGLYEQSLSCV